jgi:hypothetical protein
MDRQELIDKLSLLQPALASNNLQNLLTHFWFDGETVTAFNDRIGIRTPFKCGFKGCVPGNTLLGLLRSSTAKDVTLTERDGWIVLNTKVMDAKLAMLPLDGTQQAWNLQEPDEKWIGVAGDKLVPALVKCLRSTTDDTSIPDQLGVTFIPKNGGMSLFATNDNTITTVDMDGGKLKKRAILSAEFCRQIVALVPETTDKVRLEITDTQATLVTKKATVYGNLILSEKPVDFVKIVGSLFSDKMQDKLVPIPKFMPAALERSLIMAAAGEGEARMVISCKGGDFKCATSARVGTDVIGTIHDSINLRHPDVKATLNPKDVLKGLEFYNRMLVMDGCLVMTDDKDATFLVSTLME